MPNEHPIQLGVDACVANPPSILNNAKFGLLMNQASVDSRRRYSCDALNDRFPGQLKALFSPQHGLWCEEQDNMIETPHSIYDPLQIPLHSLYSETRRPTAEMLAGLDCLVIDLQDVGTRVYTFIWTVTHCLEACAEAGISVVILDRPNPLGGEVVEGPILEPAFQSFVGLAPIPMRHALTLGEIALWVNRQQNLGADLQVVKMDGWRRDMLWPETGLPWLPPSPNMPTFATALVYPGQVLLEGTKLSEGRGTTTPFEISGAGFVDSPKLADALAEFTLEGVVPLPVRFRPTFNKWHGQSCGGIFLSVVDPDSFRSYETTLAMLSCIQQLWPQHFELLPPPYEYETEKLPMDILTGSSELSAALQNGRLDRETVDSLVQVDADGWLTSAADDLLYS